MNFKRLLTTPTGKILLSIILGLGLATLFRNTCTDDKCIVFNGPVIEDIEDKTFKHNNKCFKYLRGIIRFIFLILKFKQKPKIVAIKMT